MIDFASHHQPTAVSQQEPFDIDKSSRDPERMASRLPVRHSSIALGPLLGLGDRNADRRTFIVTLFE